MIFDRGKSVIAFWKRCFFCFVLKSDVWSGVSERKEKEVENVYCVKITHVNRDDENRTKSEFENIEKRHKSFDSWDVGSESMKCHKWNQTIWNTIFSFFKFCQTFEFSY